MVAHTNKPIDPNNVLALGNTSATLFGLGQYQEAITWYEKAIAIDPNNALALANKGGALSGLGRYEEAISWLDKAIAIDPNNTRILELKELLQEAIR